MMLIPSEGFPDMENSKGQLFRNQLSTNVKSDLLKNVILCHHDVKFRFLSKILVLVSKQFFLKSVLSFAIY